MRMSYEDFEKSAKNNTGFFKLEDDGDSAEIRFLIETANDLNFRSTHFVKKKDGSFNYVDCLRSYDDEACLCPLCSVGKVDGIQQVQTHAWIPVYVVSMKNAKTDEVSSVEMPFMWKVSQKLLSKVIYPQSVEKGKPFVGNTFTVIRHGKAGDIYTKYELIGEDFDNAMLDDFDEIPNPDDIIVTKTFEELETFVKTRSFDENETTVNTRAEQSADPFDRRASNTGDGTYRRRGTSRPDLDN